MVNKILIVEDDKAVLKLLSEFLIKSGFQIKTAESAEEAEKILNNEKVDTVLTDIRLPGMDGIQFTKKIRKKFSIDVIVLTAYSSEYSYEDAIKNGASDLIFKPVKLNELILRINRVLRERNLINERDKMIRDLKRLTIEDPLTGLFNSRHFFNELDKEIKRSDRYLNPISLIFVDVDNFKLINDTHGHMIGDKILSIIAMKINSCLRANDSAYRFAGDEFTVILPETTSKEAKFVADRILSNFSHEAMVVDEKVISDVTLSIGISEYQVHETRDQFIHRADVLMYEAKGRGGNRVVMPPDSRESSSANMQQSSLSC